jgi:hypothetical protein
MADYFAFQSENLFLSKIIVIGIIHSILSFIVLEGALRQSWRYVFLSLLDLSRACCLAFIRGAAAVLS